jgi:hypothetical protein
LCTLSSLGRRISGGSVAWLVSRSRPELRLAQEVSPTPWRWPAPGGGELPLCCLRCGRDLRGRRVPRWSWRPPCSQATRWSAAVPSVARWRDSPPR